MSPLPNPKPCREPCRGVLRSSCSNYYIFWTAQPFFIFFCMKIEYHKTFKMMLSFFYKNAFLLWKRSKKKQKWAEQLDKINFFVYCSKLAHWIFLIFCKQLGGIKGYINCPWYHFSAKFSFSPKREKRVQKWAKIGFLDFYEKIQPLVFARNGLKWSVLWLTDFLRKSHIWEILILEIYMQKLSTNQIARFLKLLYLLNRLTVFSCD